MKSTKILELLDALDEGQTAIPKAIQPTAQLFLQRVETGPRPHRERQKFRKLAGSARCFTLRT
jgi:hypothetical protein